MAWCLVVTYVIEFLRHNTPNLGEHAAMMWSLIWASQCSDWFGLHFPSHKLVFHMYFDATGTEYQAAGWWKTVEYHDWRIFMRSLVHILEGRHGSGSITWTHVKAHNEHPWNELVDKLAKHASAAGTLVTDCEPWFSWMKDPNMLLAIQWICFYERLQTAPHDAPLLNGDILEHQTLLIPMPDSQVPALTDSDPSSTAFSTTSVRFDLRIATVNVLTLTHQERGNATAITRQRILQQQLMTLDVMSSHSKKVVTDAWLTSATTSIT